MNNTHDSMNLNMDDDNRISNTKRDAWKSDAWFDDPEDDPVWRQRQAELEREFQHASEEDAKDHWTASEWAEYREAQRELVPVQTIPLVPDPIKPVDHKPLIKGKTGWDHLAVRSVELNNDDFPSLTTPQSQPTPSSPPTPPTPPTSPVETVVEEPVSVAQPTEQVKKPHKKNKKGKRGKTNKQVIVPQLPSALPTHSQPAQQVKTPVTQRAQAPVAQPVKTVAPQPVTQRAQAFETLANKGTMSTQLVKTKMCRNVLEYGECKRRVCTFAHSPEELRPANCFFGAECRFIHSKTKPCAFLHPGETNQQFLVRTGQAKSTTRPQVQPHQPRPFVSNRVQTSVSFASALAKPQPTTPLKPQAPLTSPSKPQPSASQPVTFRCPRAMMESMALMAMSRGLTNIKFIPTD